MSTNDGLGQQQDEEGSLLYHAEESMEVTVEDHRESMNQNRLTSGGSASASASASAPAFIVDEDVVFNNPFDYDLHTNSFASAADDAEKDYYKPLPVADQMGRFARFPSTHEYSFSCNDASSSSSSSLRNRYEITTTSQRLGTTLVMGDEEEEEDDLDCDTQAHQLQTQKLEEIMMTSLGRIEETNADQEQSERSASRADTEHIFRSIEQEDIDNNVYEYEYVDVDVDVDIDSNRKRNETATAVGDPGTSDRTSNKTKSNTAKSRSVLTAGLESLKYFYSLALLIACVVLVTGTIFTHQTASTANHEVPPVAAFLVFWFLIVWLAAMEGGQGALVGLQPIDRERYRESHPKTYKNTGLLANGSSGSGDAVERFIVGRQFLVVLVVFVSQLLSSAVPGVRLWGLSDPITAVFLDSGLALMVVTIVLGQLLAQLNAARSMLDFVNNYFVLYFVTYVSLLIEFSGLLHSVYLVQILFSKIGGSTDKNRDDAKDDANYDANYDAKDKNKNKNKNKNTKTVDPEEAGTTNETTNKEPARCSVLQSFFFWTRVVFSLGVLGFAFAVTLSALFRGQTTMWKSVPKAVSVVLFFVLMCFVGMMEGMQIAFFAVLNYPEERLARQRVASNNCRLAFRGENLQSFLIGRQICVTIGTFLIARITTLDIAVGTGGGGGGTGENIFGVSDGWQTFFNTGLLGAVITTIVSSLAWRIVASSFPLAFLSNPLVNVILRLCLLFEASGICSSAWVLARYHKMIAGYQPDEVYLETTADAGAAERPTLSSDAAAVSTTTTTTTTTRDKDIDRFVTVLRFTISLALFVFSVVLVTACIFTNQTRTIADKGGEEWWYSLLVCAAFWFLIAWLAMVEGSLGCLMGLKSVDEVRYGLTHKITHKNTEMVHRGDNFERFIVGRQFLVLAIVFVCTWLTEPVVDASVLGLPDVVNKIFLSSDVALIVIIIVAGQLTAEVNAASCMLDFVNNYFVLYFVTYLSLAIESSGLLHSVYLFQIFFSKISGKAIQSSEPTRSILQRVFFWGRVVCSLLILGFAFAVTVVPLVYGEATLWKGLPDAASVAIILLLMCLVGMMEGVQIALFGLSNISEESLASHKMAYTNYKLALSEQHLQAFLIGRQICVTCFFVTIARMSNLNVVVGVDDNVFGVSDGVQRFFNTGVLGALLTTIMASLIWRLFASSFPVSFMSNPLIYVIIWLCLMVEASGICSACWVFGRWIKLAVGYQPDPVYLEGSPKEGAKPITRRDKDIDVTSTVIRYIFSSTLLCFGIAVTMSLIFTKQTELSSKSHPGVAFASFWFLLVYLGTMEGGQGCLVGLQGVEKERYKDSHGVTLKNTKIAHRGNNMQRFIVGRQFLVVLVVFIINLCGSPIPGSKVFRLPDSISAVFVDSGVSLILITVILGQLTAQVNAASCMLDFINNCFMLYFVTYISMAIEMSGLLHCVYLVQILFSKISGTAVQTNEPPRSPVQTIFFWGRATVSLAILAFAFAVTLAALFDGKTTSWESVPGVVSVIIFFVLMCIAGLMEGMQIALFAVVNLPKEEVAEHKMAKASCQLAFSGNNLQAFLIGRQIFVTLCTFVIARLTTLDVTVGTGDNIFGVPDGVQTFFNTGLLGAIITTVVGSLAWRVIAASFPVAFLSNPLVYLILRLCLILEASGICSAAWLLALINKQMFGYQPDEIHIGRTRNSKERSLVDADESSSGRKNKKTEAMDSLDVMESQEIDA